MKDEQMHLINKLFNISAYKQRINEMSCPINSDNLDK